ncbi:MAG: lytic murein transglycosylase B [Gammaproteobacteria bacterium]|nr:lytic murein transglycosylase B [Gammaproteobacteria bacterium]MDT8371215.1 lytic murein transglycosylase B [Gammaproteobacteria bacterium]
MKKLTLLLSILLMTSVSYADNKLPGVEEFIEEMHQKHDFERDKLQHLFERVEVKQPILDAISRPAEKSKPWYDYRKIFITDQRIQGGVDFWKQHQQTLANAEKIYGVPAEIILAILGVETRYGGNVGKYRVVDALSTLAFRYPPRSAFFRSELEHFLLLTREEDKSLLAPIGSYAGAMGLGQFMPSSYRRYAVDFDHDGHRDIWENPVDAIGSIANYLKLHGWIANESIVHRTKFHGDVPADLIALGYKPSLNREQLSAAGVSLDEVPAGDDVLALISLTQEDGEEYWLARQNFYSITRYNHSRMYAMAVTQLAQLIRTQYEQAK